MENKKLAMISQPMNGLTDAEIKEAKKRATEVLVALGYVVVNTFFDYTPDIKNAPVAFLARSIEAMAGVDAVYFCKGWEDARGCRIEHTICTVYHIPVFEE